jgi:hypothetical protein
MPGARATAWPSSVTSASKGEVLHEVTPEHLVRQRIGAKLAHEAVRRRCAPQRRVRGDGRVAEAIREALAHRAPRSTA